ncbi:endonuclease NucS domain-containing protein, partial [Chloroflexota bacterium]
KPADVEEEPIPEDWISLTVEKDLENFIAAQPYVIEPGLTLVKTQYETGVGRIDLLLKDRQGRPVVVETKRGRESDKVVGQVLRYMGWLLANENDQVRGIILVSEPDARLEYAAFAVPNIDLVTYKVRFELERQSGPQEDATR